MRILLELLFPRWIPRAEEIHLRMRKLRLEGI